MTGLTLSIEGGIAEIQLDDGKVNALSETMLEQLLAAIEEAAQADAALLICGRPGCFSGGYDRKLIDAGGPACDAMRAAGDRLTLALLDYPAPLVTAKADGTLDFSQAYAVGIGAWDKVAARWLYGQYAPGSDAGAAGLSGAAGYCQYRSRDGQGSICTAVGGLPGWR